MTYKKALEFAKGGLQTYYEKYPELTEQIEFQESIIEALERLIPLPPFDKEFPGAIIHYCPRCMEELDLHPNFCDGCGQAIDWELEEIE